MTDANANVGGLSRGQQRTGPAPVLRTLAGLKLRILRNSLFAARKRALWSKVVVVATIIGSLLSATRIAMSGLSGKPASTEHLTLLLTSLFGLWVFGPLLVGGVDDSLDPTRLTLLPLQRRELRTGLVMGALLGPLPLGSFITIAGAVIGFHPQPRLVPFAILAGLVAMLVNLTMARALAVTLAFAGRSRRGKDLSILLASLGAAAIFLGTQSLRFLSPETKSQIIRSLRFLPSGQVGEALLELRTGAIAIPLARLVGLALLCVAGFTVWLRGIDRLLVDPDAIRHQRKTRTTDVRGVIPKPLQRWLHTPAVILASKELRYLARSANRRSSLIVSIVIGTVFALLQSMRESSNPTTVYGAIVAALFGVHATNNVLGTDAASLWIEQTAGARLRDQLLARSAAASPNLFVPVILAGGVLASISGGWKQFAVLTFMTFALLGVPLGVGSVISVIAPFGQPDSSNPYSNKRATTGQGGLVSICAVVGIAAIIVLSLLPVGVIYVMAIVGGIPLAAIGGVLTFVYSVIVWRLGAKVALRVVRGKETELLASIGGRKAAT